MLCKKIKFIILSMLIILCACQENYLETDSEELNLISLSKERIWQTISVNPLSKAAALKNKCWQTGDIIKIKFLNGSETLKNKIKEYSQIWTNYANITFLYVEGNQEANVKIGFDLDTNYIAWSTIGTDCNAIPQDEPSLNFVWLDEETDEIIQREVLRGFGNVLGLVFEHQNPNAPVQIKATADIASEFNLSEKKSYRNSYSIYINRNKFQ